MAPLPKELRIHDGYGYCLLWFPEYFIRCLDHDIRNQYDDGTVLEKCQT